MRSYWSGLFKFLCLSLLKEPDPFQELGFIPYGVANDTWAWGDNILSLQISLVHRSFSYCFLSSRCSVTTENLVPFDIHCWWTLQLSLVIRSPLVMSSLLTIHADHLAFLWSHGTPGCCLFVFNSFQTVCEPVCMLTALKSIRYDTQLCQGQTKDTVLVVWT